MKPSDRLIEDLIALAFPQVWSLVVTIFGDLAGEPMMGKDLQALLGQMGVKPEAVRVAMHRLKNDGWITTTRYGREVTYHLSDHGRDETMRARKDIYRRDEKFAGGWRVIVTPDEQPAIGPVIRLSKTVTLIPKGSQIPDNGLALALDETLPQWVQDALVPPHLFSLASGLLSLVSQPVPVDDAVVRLLVLHHWRKLALKDGVWAHISLVPNGVCAQCHRKVIKIIGMETL
jgi:phenylacetic acid degradation operon negative regulatory protein